MDGGTPFYSSFGSNIYASDIIVQSIRCKANEFKKLQPRHIKTTAEGQSVVNDSSIAGHSSHYEKIPIMLHELVMHYRINVTFCVIRYAHIVYRLFTNSICPKPFFKIQRKHLQLAFKTYWIATYLPIVNAQ